MRAPLYHSVQESDTPLYHRAWPSGMQGVRTALYMHHTIDTRSLQNPRRLCKQCDVMVLVYANTIVPKVIAQTQNVIVGALVIWAIYTQGQLLW